MIDIDRPASKYLDTNGYRTHYIENGTGHPVILIHGGGPGADSWGNWFGCLPAFGAKFRAIAIDMVGYGNTEAPADFVYSQQTRNEQLIAFIEALDAGPVSLVGNSMGGATSLGVAMARPELVKDMVLMGSAGLNFSVGRVADAMQPLAKFDFTMEGMKRIAAHLGGKNFTPVPGMAEYRLELASRPERRASFQAGSEWIWANQGIHYAEDEIAKVKTRTLIVNGKNDPIVILPQAFRFLELLDNSTGYIIPNCGHWAMLEYPELFSSLSIQFLEGNL